MPAVRRADREGRFRSSNTSGPLSHSVRGVSERVTRFPARGVRALPGYSRSSSNLGIGEDLAVQHQTSARDEPADLPAGSSSGCGNSGIGSLRPTVAAPWRADASTRILPRPFGQDHNAGTDRNAAPCPHQTRNPRSRTTGNTDGNAHSSFWADKNTIANGNGDTGNAGHDRRNTDRADADHHLLSRKR